MAASGEAVSRSLFEPPPPPEEEREALISHALASQSSIVKDNKISKRVDFDTTLQDKRLQKLRGRQRSGSKKSEEGSVDYSETGKFVFGEEFCVGNCSPMYVCRLLLLFICVMLLSS